MYLHIFFLSFVILILIFIFLYFFDSLDFLISLISLFFVFKVNTNQPAAVAILDGSIFGGPRVSAVPTIR